MAQAFFERNFRLEADRLTDAVDAGAGFRHVTGLRRKELNFRFFPEESFKHFDEEPDFHRTMMADIKNAVRRLGWMLDRVEQHFQYAFDNIIDISEVAERLALIKQAKRRAFGDRLGENYGRHIRTAPALETEISVA